MTEIIKIKIKQMGRQWSSYGGNEKLPQNLVGKLKTRGNVGETQM